MTAVRTFVGAERVLRSRGACPHELADNIIFITLYPHSIVKEICFAVISYIKKTLCQIRAAG
jgi:hypothetical protein